MAIIGRSGAVALLAALALGMAACGKTGSHRASSGGPVLAITGAVAAPGAVSVATRNTTRLGGGEAVADAAAVARTVYPGLTSDTRPRAVVIVDRANRSAALAAAALAGAPLDAPLLYSEGGKLPELTRETLAALRPTGVTALGGVQVISIGAGSPAGFLTRRIATGEAATTAVAVEQLLASVQPVAATRSVIVVPSDAPAPLQMPAAGLAAESATPILYAAGTGVPAATRAALAALRKPAIYLIDAAALGAHAIAQLRALGPVTSVSSGSGEESSAAGNAIAVARFTNGTFGWGVKEPGHGVVIANVARPLDAPAAAPLSATGDYAPLLLVEGAAAVPAALSTYLGDIQPAYTSAPQFRPVRGVYNHGWLIGDESAISAIAQAEIDTLLEISPRKQSSEEASVQQAE
ncbi:MAG TPA: hypothetical protein VHT27_02020 [Solirubrobacteraceae bacterium]|jgi:hypothetical protein|nr:hypothetical protein [Solirubrobacteraceae bacterium]